MDKVIKGRQGHVKHRIGFHRGETNPNAIFTEEVAREVLLRYNQGGVSQRELGRQYGFTAGAVQALVEGSTWKHLDIPRRTKFVPGKTERFNQRNGSDINLAKLDDDKVRQMHRMFNAGETNYALLGRLFGISKSAARAVILRRTWKHVDLY